MDKKTIADVFVKNGLINKHELTVVLKENERSPNESIESTLLRLYFATEQEIARALSRHHRLPYINLIDVNIDKEALSAVPLELASRYMVFPVWLEEDTLVVAMKDPMDKEAIHALKEAGGYNVHAHMAAEIDIKEAINSFYSVDQAVAAYLKKVAFPKELKILSSDEKEGKSYPAGQEAVHHLLCSVMSHGLSRNAQEIVIVPSGKTIKFLSGVDGRMGDLFQTPRWMENVLLSHAKILAGVNPSDTYSVQAGMIRVENRGKIIEFKTIVRPIPGGEEFIIRFPEDIRKKSADKKSPLPDIYQKEVDRILSRPQGVLIVSGPLGSGRSSSLMEWAEQAAQQKRAVSLISDTASEVKRGVTHVRVNPRTGVTFPRALRTALLHESDVVAIDELRDRETAEMAFCASLEKHLVLASLHTMDCASVFIRLWDIKVKRDLLASSLSGILAQRLVRALCQSCREERKPLPAPMLKNVPVLYRAKGCEDCGQTGYQGLLAIHEFLAITPEWRKRLMQPDLTRSEINGALSASGFVSLQTRALEVLKDGMTTVEELERHGLIPSDVLIEPEPKPEEAPPQAADVHPAPVFQKDEGEKKEEEPSLFCQLCGSTLSPFRDKKEKSDKSYRVLVAEDDTHVAGMMSSLLSKEGYQVQCAPNGREAWEYAQREKPHLLITDVVMPEMTGLELIRRLRENVTTAFIPAIILSQKKDVEDRIQGYEAGTDDFIPKPFENKEMRLRIRSVLNRTYH